MLVCLFKEEDFDHCMKEYVNYNQDIVERTTSRIITNQA